MRLIMVISLNGQLWFGIRAYSYCLPTHSKGWFTVEGK